MLSRSRFEEEVRRAELTFEHQLVYDPATQALVPLQPYPADIDVSSLVCLIDSGFAASRTDIGCLATGSALFSNVRIAYLNLRRNNHKYVLSQYVVAGICWSAHPSGAGERTCDRAHQPAHTRTNHQNLFGFVKQEFFTSVSFSFVIPIIAISSSLSVDLSGLSDETARKVWFEWMEVRQTLGAHASAALRDLKVRQGVPP
jgi:hypothetical protein